MFLREASCYVHLHGYGCEQPVEDDWYRAMAVNGVVYVNASDGNPADEPGLFTYIIRPDDCSASDFQHFHGFSPDMSFYLVDYLQDLADGTSLFTLMLVIFKL